MRVKCDVDPIDALRAATITAMNFLAADAADAPTAVVTYNDDPRSKPDVLNTPAAVVIGGTRVR